MTSISTSKAAPSAEREWERAVRREQLGILVQQGPFLSAVNLVNSALVAVIVGPGVSLPVLSAWLAAVAILALYPLRGWWLSRRRRPHRRHGSRGGIRKATLLAMLSGLVWAIAVPLFSPALDPTRELLLYVVVSGMAAGGGICLGAIRPAAIAYTASVGSTVLVYLFANGGVLYVCFAIMLLLFFIITNFASHSVFSAAARALKQKALAIDDMVREQERARILAEENEQRFRTITESMPVPIVIARYTDGTILYVNAQAEALLGTTSDELVGQSSKTLYWNPDEREAYMPQLHAERHVAGTPLAMRRADGTKIIVEVASRLVTYNGEEVILGSFVDITQRRLLEAQLQQAQKMRAVGQLTGGIAHDFNNLLAAIIGSAELLQGEARQNGALRDLMTDTILKAGERGADLTRQLLAFSRKQSLKPTSIDVGDLLDSMVELIRRTIGTNIEITTCHEATQWPCTADPGQLQNVILNLAINARDAMPDGGRIILETANVTVEAAPDGTHDLRPGDYVLITVRDTGAGMSPEILERAFEPFFTTKGVGEGTGLGLSMVYGFVKQSGGHAEIRSEPGHGTAVRIYLPRATSAVDRGAVVAAEVPEGHGETILVVEGDDQVRTAAVSMLESLGYRVQEARDGASALQALARQTNVDLMLSDIVLPGAFTGLEVAKLAREHHAGLKIIFMSAYCDHSTPAGAAPDGGEITLQKPFRRAELAAGVRKTLTAA